MKLSWIVYAIMNKLIHRKGMATCKKLLPSICGKRFLINDVIQDCLTPLSLLHYNACLLRTLHILSKSMNHTLLLVA